MVDFLFPLNNLTEVDIPGAFIEVGFNGPIDIASLTPESFKVADANGALVTGSFAVEPFGNFVISFTPDRPLARSTEYRVSLTSSIKDLAGNSLAPEYNSRFTTITDSPWRATSVDSAMPDARRDHVAVWTGSEMIVHGGVLANGSVTTTGARYNPATDTWTPMASGSRQWVPLTAVWTGTEMITWGGGAGERYSPSSDSWTAVTASGAPSGTSNHTAVWTGTEMIVWGGAVLGAFAPTNNGGRFNPSTGLWSDTNDSPAGGVPSPRYRHSAVWTGTEMIIWGGGTFPPPPPSGGSVTITGLGDGARYNPVTDTWTPVSNVGAPSARMDHHAIWTGQEMIIWGGNGGSSGARYNPQTDTWSAIAPASISTEFGSTVVWTGSEMIVWSRGLFGTPTGDTSLSNGARYNPAANTWRKMTRENNSVPRAYHTAIWTGTDMIVWGGSEIVGDGSSSEIQDGAIYTP